MRQVILDTETTGLQTAEGHRIIEIGCIELINRKFTGKRYHQYINPERAIEASALEVHGITLDFLQSKPVFASIAKEFLDFIYGAELIIHNAPFDIGFIHYELSLLDSKWQPLTDHCRIIDTLTIARQLHVGQRNSLDALCKRYSIDNTKRELHGALMDAHLLAQVYLAMTGGQGSLFDGLQVTQVVTETMQTIQERKVQSRNLMVLDATSDEISEHRQYLEKIFKGKSLWETLVS